MKKFVYAVFAVLLIAGLAFPVFAATTAPSWVSTESQNRVRQWFLKDQQEALYSTLGDLTDAGGFWATVGNTGTTAGTHFIGTVDARDLVFKTHNTEVFRLADGANATWTGDSATDTFNLLVGNLKVGNGTPDLTLSTEDAYIEGGLEVDGPVYADGGLNLSLIFNMEPVDYVLGGTQSLTPAASFYTLDPTEALTLTLAINSANAGDLLFLTNVSTYTVTIADTNLLSSTGSALTMGQDAVAVFIFVGASWYEIALSDNS